MLALAGAPTQGRDLLVPALFLFFVGFLALLALLLTVCAGVCLCKVEWRLFGLLTLLVGALGGALGIPATLYFNATYWLPPPAGPIIPTVFFCLLGYFGFGLPTLLACGAMRLAVSTRMASEVASE